MRRRRRRLTRRHLRRLGRHMHRQHVSPPQNRPADQDGRQNHPLLIRITAYRRKRSQKRLRSQRSPRSLVFGVRLPQNQLAVPHGRPSLLRRGRRKLQSPTLAGRGRLRLRRRTLMTKLSMLRSSPRSRFPCRGKRFLSRLDVGAGRHGLPTMKRRMNLRSRRVVELGLRQVKQTRTRKRTTWRSRPLPRSHRRDQCRPRRRDARRP